jgi:hypothetical protein
MMNVKFTSNVLGRKRVESEPPATFLSALEDIDTMRKYLINFEVKDNTTAALSSIENEVCWVQQKAKKQQLTLMDVWKK